MTEDECGGQCEQCGHVEETMVKTRKYIQNINLMIKNIEKLEPKDRLDYCVAIQTCIESMLYSLGGWNSWLSSLFALKEISDKEFKEIFPKIKKISTEFLRIDESITSSKLTEATVKIKERIKKSETANKTKYRV